MIELTFMFVLGVFPVFRLWWCYRVKAIAMNTMSMLAKMDIDNGGNWENRHSSYEREEQSIWRMFFQFNRWNVAHFFCTSVFPK